MGINMCHVLVKVVTWLLCLLCVKTAFLPPQNASSRLAPANGVVYADLSGNGTVLRCMHCSRAEHILDCLGVISCASTEVCYIEKEISRGGWPVINAGCRSQHDCSVISCFGESMHGYHGQHKKRASGSLTCHHCCDGDFCNLYGCPDSEDMYVLPSSRCLSCDVIRDPVHCDKMINCESTQECVSYGVYHMGELRFELGCEDKVLCEAFRNHSVAVNRTLSPPTVGKRQVSHHAGELDLASSCCSGHLCNRIWPAIDEPLPSAKNGYQCTHQTQPSLVNLTTQTTGSGAQSVSTKSSTITSTSGSPSTTQPSSTPTLPSLQASTATPSTATSIKAPTTNKPTPLSTSASTSNQPISTPSATPAPTKQPVSTSSQPTVATQPVTTPTLPPIQTTPSTKKLSSSPATPFPSTQAISTPVSTVVTTPQIITPSSKVNSPTKPKTTRKFIIPSISHINSILQLSTSKMQTSEKSTVSPLTTKASTTTTTMEPPPTTSRHYTVNTAYSALIPDQCIDRRADCQVEQDICSSMTLNSVYYCSKYCGFCTVPTKLPFADMIPSPCADREAHCKDVYGVGICNNRTLSSVYYCSKYCGYCN